MRFRPVFQLARGLQKVGRQDRRNNTMKSLALQPILSNLAEAHGELARLFARIQFVVFGEVVDETVQEWAENVARDERTSPLDGRALFDSLLRAYRHLNVAWNCHHEFEERVRQCDPTDVARWSKFPRGALFRDLWPAPSRCRGTPREPGRGHVAPNSLQAAFLQMAVRKLDILRYRITCALGTDSPGSVPRPKGLRPRMENDPITEEEFGRRLHRIYSDMNFAWAYRTYRKGGESLSRKTVRRRRQFPHVFLLMNGAGGESMTAEDDISTFTAAERAVWFRMKRLLDEVREEEQAIAPPAVAPPFLCGILWPPRDNDWLSGREPEEVAEQGRLLERAVRSIEGSISPKLLRAELRVAKCAQARAYLRACRKWKDDLWKTLLQHP